MGERRCVPDSHPLAISLSTHNGQLRWTFLAYDTMQTEFDPDYPTMGFALRALDRGELPGSLPLQEWEDETKLNVEVNIYGG